MVVVLADDRGDVILGGMVRTVLALLLVGLVVFEIGAVAVNAVQLAEVADDASRAAALTMASSGRVSAAESAAHAVVAEQVGVVVDAVEIDRREATVGVSRTPLFLVVGHVAPLRDRLTRHVVQTAPVG